MAYSFPSLAAHDCLFGNYWKDAGIRCERIKIFILAALLPFDRTIFFELPLVYRRGPVLFCAL